MEAAAVLRAAEALSERAAARAAAVGVGQHFVVFGAFVLVGQGFVGAVDFGGALGGVGLFADVGMVFAHQFAVGFFNGVGIGGFFHAEYVVIVFFCHVFYRCKSCPMCAIVGAGAANSTAEAV